MKKSIGLFLFAVGLTQLSVSGADWTQWRGSNRDLIVTEKNLLTSWPEGGPKQLWQVKLPGAGYSEPIIAKGVMYITGNEGQKCDLTGYLYALDCKTGAILWKQPYGTEWDKNFESARTSPTVVGDKLYLISGLGVVTCFDINLKKQVWSVDTFKEYGGRNITWGIAESPLVYDNKVICQPGGANASIVALDAKTGKLVWKSQGLSEKSSYCSPALLTIDGKRQVVTMLEDNVVGVCAEKGTPLWKVGHRNQHAVHPNTPILVGPNKIFVSSGYKYGSEMIEIKGNNAEIVWNDKSSDNHFQGTAIYEGRIFSSGGGRLSCFDPKDGKELCKVTEAKKVTFCITPAGMITYDENGGKVMLVSIKTCPCKVVSSFKINYGEGQHWSSPVVADGILYLRHGTGVAAFDIRAK
jgi:outer membrane protein assembly factor BamB